MKTKKNKKPTGVERKIWLWVVSEADRAIAEAKSDAARYLRTNMHVAAASCAFRIEYAERHRANALAILNGEWRTDYKTRAVRP